MATNRPRRSRTSPAAAEAPPPRRVPVKADADLDLSAPVGTPARAAARPVPPSVRESLRKSGVDAALMQVRDSFRERLAAAAAAVVGTAGSRATLAAAPVVAAAAGKLGSRNVVGTAFGDKWSKGRPTGRRSVLVLVKKKMDPDRVAPELLLPPDEVVGGERIPYDVVEVGQPRLLHCKPGEFIFPEQPVRWGGSISGAETGTYGCFVYRRPTDEFPNGQNCILSNNHVLAGLNPAIGSPIVQPGDCDNDEGQRTVGRLVAYESLALDAVPAQGAHFPNLMDAAIARSSSTQIAARFHGDYEFNPTPVAAVQGMTVMKEGRTTGFTQGVVDAVDAHVIDLPYGTPNNPAPYGSFYGQLQLRGANGQPFSLQGDSGSLVCGLAPDDDGVWRWHPVGLLFAGTDPLNPYPFSYPVSWANPIQEVLNEFKIDIVFDPGH